MEKKYLVFTVLLLCVSMCKPMDNDAARATCKKVEQISPDASPEHYIALMKTLRKEQLSVCDCVKQLSEDRINAQKPALEQEWKISENEWKEFNVITQRINRQDNQQGKVIIDIDRKSFPAQYLTYFTQENIKRIENKFRQAGCNNNTIKIIYDPPQHIGTQAGIHDARVTRSLKKGRAGDFSLLLGPIFFDRSLEGQEGVLLHEISGHVAHKDLISDTLLLFGASIGKPELLKNHIRFYQSASFLNMRKAEELRADQVPASTNSTNARLIESWLTETKNKYGNSADDQHDSIDTRLAMATRIRKLKEAEEQLPLHARKVSFLSAFSTYLKKEMA